MSTKDTSLHEALVSKCCHDIISPLTATLLAFDTLAADADETDPVLPLVQKNLKKTQLLITLWRSLFGQTAILNCAKLSHDLIELAKYQEINVHISSEAEQYFHKPGRNPLIIKAVFGLLYLAIKNSTLQASITLHYAPADNTIALHTDNPEKLLNTAASPQDVNSCVPYYISQLLQNAKIKTSTKNSVLYLDLASIV